MGWEKRFALSLRWFEIVVLVLLFPIMELKFAFVFLLELVDFLFHSLLFALSHLLLSVGVASA